MQAVVQLWKVGKYNIKLKINTAFYSFTFATKVYASPSVGSTTVKTNYFTKHNSVMPSYSSTTSLSIGVEAGEHGETQSPKLGNCHEAKHE